MAELDAKWHVPDGFDITERSLALPPPRGLPPAAPVLSMLSVRALEDQASGDGVLALFAWQLMAGAEIATRTLEQLEVTQDLSGLELLMLGHAYAASGIGQGQAFEIAQRARKLLKMPLTVQSVEANLLLAATALPYGVGRVRTLLDMIEPELVHGGDEHHAVHALIRAAADPEPARLADAHARFTALEDAFGLAQCALVAHAHEAATTKRAPLLRGYLEHAIFRYESDGRPEWAARTISHALVPLLADELGAPAGELGELLGRAAALAMEARSQLCLEAVFRMAAKLGFAATLTTLSQFDPPTFRRPDAAADAAASAPPSAPATSAPATSAPATSAPPAAEAPKPKKAAAKKGGKRRRAAS